MKTKILLIITAAVILFCWPNVNFGQMPVMGAASNFVLFSTTGAVGNTSISKIIGNAGADNGAVTGFGGLNGTVYNNDAMTIQAKADLTTVYNQLNGRVATMFPGVILGNGQILDSGVYSIAAATSLNADLTLDAQGDSSAVFIIKINGAFSTNPASSVNLINGASACNVFWTVEGAVSMAAGSTVRGTFIANNAAFSMAAGDSLEGRGLSTTGAVSVNNVYANNVCGVFILPIELLSFTGACAIRDVVLKWSTAGETNNSYFTVERSAEGRNWQVVGTVKGAGNSSVMHSYSLTDKLSLPGTAFYRLKQTDFDGNNKYGIVIAIAKCGGDATENLTLYPNPSDGKFAVLFTGDRSQLNSTEIFNSSGEKVFGSTGLPSTFDLSGQAAGIYFLNAHLYSETLNRILVVKK